MKIIVPMAGTGNRFLLKGYVDPKPLIKVNGKRIIEYVLEMFSKNDDIIFICNEEHLAQTEMREILSHLSPGSKIVSMPAHKLGPVHTVMAAFNELDDDEDVLISYCDNPFLWNIEDFKSHVKIRNLDGCILTHTGFHPHTLSSTKMAFVKENSKGLVEEIQEKKCYTSNPMDEHASTGVYYFKSGRLVKKYFADQVKKDLHYNGEFYVTLTYNLLISDGLRVGYYDTPHVTVFGTPEEVENFEAWSTLLKGEQVNNEEQLIQCYRYWKDYYAKSHLC